MKKIVAIFIAVILAISVSACAGVPENNGKLKIVTTIFPIYDWAREVTKGVDNTDVSLLLENGVDMHSFQPSADDIINISTADMFIYAGGESDKWVNDALNEAVNKDMVVVNLLDCLGDAAKREETIEGMQNDEEEEENELDEHIWLSLENADDLSGAIADRLAALDPENSEKYNKNWLAYSDKLDSLDKKYYSAVENAKYKTAVFADRFPFRYLFDDYELNYYAAFAGCSAETEASFKTITFLADKLDELGLPAVMQIETSDGSMAKTVRDNTKAKNQQILTMDSMQSVSSSDMENGTTYLKIMEKNLKVLKKALA